MFELVESAQEEVVAGIDPEKLFGAPEVVVEGLELGAGAVLVVGRLDEIARAAAAHGVSELGGVDGRETGGDDAAGAGIFQRSREGNGGAGAEAEAGQGERQSRVAAAQFGQAGTGVFDFAGTAVVGAAAEVDAAEVEAQDDATGAAQAAGEAVDDLVVQGTAVDGMGMADKRSFDGRAGVGLFKQGFETPGGTGDEERFDAARHKGLGGDQSDTNIA